MGRLTFLHPWALWLSAGAVVPLLIHLFSRHKPVNVRFPAVRFILRSRRRSARRTRLKQLLLLLLRMGLIVLFALLVARPLLGPARAAEGEPAGTPAAIFILDDSLSMGYTVGDTSWFDGARSRALQFAENVPAGAAVGMMTTSRPTGRLERNAEHLVGRIRGSRPGTGADPCWRALERAAELLRSVGASRRDIFLFTDMTPGAWRGYRGGTHVLGQEVNLHVVDCGAGEAVNGAVVELRDEGQTALRGASLGLNARILASGGPLSRTLEFEFDGQTIHREEVRLGAGEEDVVRAVVRLKSGGHHWGRAGFLNPDGLVADDARAFTLEVAQEVTVLCLDGGAGERIESPSYFLRLALNPWADPERGIFRVRSASASRLGDLALSPFDVVAIVGESEVSEEAWQRLAAYVAGGGGLIVFCGPETGDAYRSAEAAEALGVEVGETVVAPADEPFGMRTVRTGHPLADALEQSGAGLSQARFRRCRRLKPLGSAQELISLGPGLPGLVSSGDAGRAAVFASTADDRWGVFARTPLFVPFCRELVLYASGRTGRGIQDYAVGAHVPIQFEPGRWPTIVRVRAPGASDAERLLPGTTPGRLTYWKTDQPGYYRVDFQRRDERWAGGFAVNAAPVESRLEKVPFERLKEAIQAGSVALVSDAHAGGAAAMAGAGARELGPYLMVFALLVATAECFLANRFYGSRSAAPQP